MNVTVAIRRRPKIFFGWYIVVAAALINTYGAGVWFYGFPIFYKALLDTFGWSAAAGATTMAQVWLFVVVYGISYGGAIPVYMAIIGEYFGRRNFATIRGFNQLFHIPTTVLGPVLAGWVYDTTGNYQTAFMTFIAALLVSVVFLFFARRPQPPVAVALVANLA